MHCVLFTCAPSFAGRLVVGVRLACLAAIGSRRFCVDVMCAPSCSRGVAIRCRSTFRSRRCAGLADIWYVVGAGGDLVVVLELVVSGLRGCVQIFLARVIRFLRLSRLGPCFVLGPWSLGPWAHSHADLVQVVGDEMIAAFGYYYDHVGSGADGRFW